jgi:hypothetical protein
MPNGVLMPKPVVSSQPAQPQQNIFQKIGGGINDYMTNPNNQARNVLDYIFGVKNPLDGATLDYQHKDAQGRPQLVPAAQPTTFAGQADQSLGSHLINTLLIKPTVGGFQQLANTASDRIGGWNPSSMATDTHYGDQSTNNGLYGVVNALDTQLGITPAETRNPFVGETNKNGQNGIDPMAHPILGTISTVANVLGLLGPIAGIFSKGGKAAVATKDAVTAAEDTSALGRAAPDVAQELRPPTTVTPDVPPMEAPTVTPTVSAPGENPLLLPQNAGAPTPNGILSNPGISGFVTKTPQQISETEKALNLIKQIDAKTNVIRQGKVSDLTPDAARELIRQRNALIDVAQGKTTLEEALKPPVAPTDVTAAAPVDVPPANGASVPGQPDLGTPGANPVDGTISSNPTKADIQNIVDNTMNPSAPKTPAPQLTPQNELPNITQNGNQGLTGELKLNSNGQLYQVADQATARDTAVKNLLDGKTPAEYLANAQATGQADSAELAILLDRTPQSDPVWTELASLKGKLGTQKGQALALLERTMRQSATPEQLASRTLQKAATAGFDTTQIANDINGVNKAFTDARDAYNVILNDPQATNAEIQAAKDAFYRATKESFTNEGNILAKAAKTKEQKNLAYNVQKKSDVYLQGIGTSSLTSSPTSVLRNFAQGTGSLLHQAGLAPKIEAGINRAFGGAKTGSFDLAGAKTGFKTGTSQLKSEIAARNAQLGLTKNPMSWIKHPISAIRQATTTGTELGNIPMEGAIRGGMSSEYKQILKEQGYSGSELTHLTERNTITDPLNIRSKYAKEINDLNGLSSEVDRTGGTFRTNIKNGFTKLGVTDKTSEQLADFVDRDIFGFFKPTLIVGKKTADYATGGIAHLVPAISKLSRGDKAGFVNEISKTIATSGVTLPVWGATGYALAKSGVLKQNDYGEWEIGNVPISGYLGAFAGPLAMGAIAGQNQHDGKPSFDGFAGKAYQTLINTYPYGEVGQKLGAAADVVGGVTSGVSGGQQAYGFKEGVASIVGGLAKENIPASAFLNTLTKMLGGNVKDTTIQNPKNADTFQAGITGLQEAGAKVIAGLPGVSNLLPDKKNSFGDTIAKPTAGEALLGAGNDSIAQSDAATGITPAGAQGLNSTAKANLVTADDKKAYNDAIQTLKDNGTDVTDSNVFKQLAKVGNYTLAAKYDTNINQDLTGDQKTAIAKYDALDSGHQTVYLQTPKNALDYYSAQIENKNKNGTLNNEDTAMYSVWGGSGNSLMVKAAVAKTNVDNNVPNDVLNLYRQVTTKKQYNSLNAEQKANLSQYASELEANGVVVRDFLSAGGSGGSGSRSSAGSIPLTRAVTSGGGGTGKFAHQKIATSIPQVVKPMPQYVIQQRKISVN